MKKKIILLIVCAGITGIIGFRLVSNKRKINEKNQPVQVTAIRIPVTVSIAKEEIQETGIVKTGVLAPFKEAKVLAVSNGNIERLFFQLGSSVRQGQTLAVIDTRLLQLDLQKSGSRVNRLRRDLQTYTELLAGNAATQEKVNTIRQDYEDALNEVTHLQRQIADASIKAPTSGIIGAKIIEEGMFVAAGTEIASIVNLSQLKVQVNLTEAEVYQVAVGQKVKLTTDVYPGKSIWGTVSFISPQANKAFNYPVEITAANDQQSPLHSGTFVYADFSKKTPQKILLIPRESLNETSQNATVFLVKEGKAELRNIQVGSEYGNHIQVISGLLPGDQVITSGQINLKDGAFIQVSK